MIVKAINLLLFTFFIGAAFSANAVTMLRLLPSDAVMAPKPSADVNALLVIEKTQSKKQQYAKKLMKQISKRMDKMNNSFGSVFSSPRFRLGALLLLLGIIGGILVNILTLAQIFGWLSGLVALAGLILMIMALVAHS
jgi:hypothetical protein